MSVEYGASLARRASLKRLEDASVRKASPQRVPATAGHVARCAVLLTDGQLSELRASLPADWLTRFAPAPTGWLHLGHILNAEYVWGIARAIGGRVLLRIEDHDRSRARPEFEAGILDDLDWLGYTPDIYPTDAYRAGVCAGRQGARDSIYRAAIDVLAAQGLLYGCDCSRRVIAAAQDGERRYSGRCRTRNLALTEGIGWRLRMDPGVETFRDVRLGIQQQDPAADCGDLLVRDRAGHWTYQFAVTVDDWHQHVDLVIRGTDLLGSTARQIRVARLLGRKTMPVFLHHPLIMKSPDRKMSKSDGDSGVRDLRAKGWSPEQVRHAALEALGGFRVAAPRA
jgi:glutamyl/glutaminyl-tRNA synthetase